MRANLLFALSLVGFLALAPLARGDELSDQVRAIEQFNRSEGSVGLAARLAVIDRLTAAIPPEAFSRLFAVVNDPAQPSELRSGLMRVLVRKATDVQAKQVIASVPSWTEVYRTGYAAWLAGKRKDAGVEGAFIGTVVAQLNSEPWRTWVGSDSGTLTLLAGILTKQIPLSLQAAGIEDEGVTPGSILAALPAPKSLVSRIAADSILASQGTMGVDWHLCQLLDPEALARLRAAVSRDSRDPLDFHFGAAFALAEVGDEQSIELFRARQQKNLSPTANGGADGATGVNRTIEGLIDRIRLQHPPDGLLAVIAGTGAKVPLGGQEELWALRRAVNLGLDRQLIRTSVLAGAERLRGTVIAGSSKGKMTTRDAYLAELKKEGIRLGVLSANDLPEIKVPAMPFIRD